MYHLLFAVEAWSSAAYQPLSMVEIWASSSPIRFSSDTMRSFNLFINSMTSLTSLAAAGPFMAGLPDFPMPLLLCVILCTGP